MTKFNENSQRKLNIFRCYAHSYIHVRRRLSVVVGSILWLMLVGLALGRMSTLPEQRRPGSAIVAHRGGGGGAVESPVLSKPNGTLDVGGGGSGGGLGEMYGGQGLHKANVYVLGEKTQMKVSQMKEFP